MDEALTLASVVASHAVPDQIFEGFIPGNLVVSVGAYMGPASTVVVGQPLPPNCPSNASCGKPATNDGSYPDVWKNAITQ